MNPQQIAFLATVAPAAQATQKQFGIPACITIAQSIFESSNKNGWGQSTLAREANNYFGVKAAHFANPDSYIELPTGEFENGVETTVEQPFARYATPTDSFLAHGCLLATAPRYAPAMAVASNPEQFARAIQACGYSTNRPPLAKAPPYYADGLLRAVAAYNLQKYDTLPT